MRKVGAVGLLQLSELNINMFVADKGGIFLSLPARFAPKRFAFQ